MSDPDTPGCDRETERMPVNTLRSYTVFVACTIVAPRAAMPSSTIVEMDVRAPTETAAINVGLALAVDRLFDARRLRVNKVWLGEPTR